MIEHVAALALASAFAGAADAQTYPDRPVKIVSDSAPGSAIDCVLRIIGDRLSHIWGQQVVIVNQPGAGGAISARAAAAAEPDGYTLMTPSEVIAFVHAQKQLWNPLLGEFAPK